jgi:hypothetical protein
MNGSVPDSMTDPPWVSYRTTVGPTPFDAGDTGRYSRVAAPRPDARASAATTRARLGTPTVSSGERFPQLHGWTMG